MIHRTFQNKLCSVYMLEYMKVNVNELVTVLKSVYQMKYKRGKFMGSIAPYGYNLHEGKLLPRDDYTVDIVRDIFNKYLEGWGHDKIARYLTNRDIPTPSQVVGKATAGLYW